jgi:hypothetical protein
MPGVLWEWLEARPPHSPCDPPYRGGVGVYLLVTGRRFGPAVFVELTWSVRWVKYAPCIGSTYSLSLAEIREAVYGW